MASICTHAFGEDWVIEFDYHITDKGYCGSGPSWNDPGSPPEPMEYEITSVTLYRDRSGFGRGPDPEPAMDLPQWLETQLLNWLAENPDVYEEVAKCESSY